jgi:hypothetical protein
MRGRWPAARKPQGGEVIDADRRAPAKLIVAPARSIIWIAMWVLVELFVDTFLAVIGPDNWFPKDAGAGRGSGVMLSLPIISLIAIVVLLNGAVRRSRPYREQQASVEGVKLQAAADAINARKRYAGLMVAGITLAVLFGLMALFVAVEFATPVKIDLVTVIAETICLLIVGIPAAGTLSLALRRRAARRRNFASRHRTDHTSLEVQ